MIKVKYYLDTRRPKKDGLFPLRLALRKNGTVVMHTTGISLKEEQWDVKSGRVVNHPCRDNLNRIILIKKGAIEAAILEYAYLGKFTGKSASEVLEILMPIIDPEKDEILKERQNLTSSFAWVFTEFANSKQQSTKALYLETKRKIEAYCTEEAIEFSLLRFDDITERWLNDFVSFCAKSQKVNTTGRHLRDIRAVFNEAIKLGITTNYPFRKGHFQIKVAETRDKSFSSTELKKLFSLNNLLPGEQEAVDIFKLMFFFRGINPVDLCHLTDIQRGRVEFYRYKTGKLYSVKVEPEALEIIEKYKGEKYLLNILERTPNYKTYFNRQGKALRKIGLVRTLGKKNEGAPLFPGICAGSARTSWATIAQEELGCTKEEIAAGLGHHTVDVTDTYMRTKWKSKVDEINRRMIDLVVSEA